MPKIYSEKEKQQIIAKLKEEANRLMQEKGVKKTTVDELVKRVGIPKGTFYLFYPSKEMLLYDVSQDFHKKVDTYLNDGMLRIMQEKNISPDQNADFSSCVEELTDLILGAMRITYSSCLSVLMNPESINLILSKIPVEVLERHRLEDRVLGDGIFEEFARKRGFDAEKLIGAFLMIIFGGLYKREIGEDNWEGSMRILIKGIVLQLVG